MTNTYLTLDSTENYELQKLLKRSLSQQKNNKVLAGLLQRLQAFPAAPAPAEHSNEGRSKPYDRPGRPRSKAGGGGGRGGRAGRREGKGKGKDGASMDEIVLPDGGGGGSPGGGQQGGNSADWVCNRGTVNFNAAWQQVNAAAAVHSDSGPFLARLASFMRSEACSGSNNVVAQPTGESLKCLVQRVQQSQAQSVKTSFILLVDQLRLFALVQSLGSIAGIYEKEVAKWENPPSKRTFYDWVEEGSKVAVLAAGGTMYLIVMVCLAGMKNAISAMSGDVAHAMANTLRAPDLKDPVGSLVCSTIVPTLSALRYVAPFNMSALFPTIYLVKKSLPLEVDAGDLAASDRVMDSFWFSHFSLVKRNPEAWKQLLLIPHKSFRDAPSLSRALISREELFLPTPEASESPTPLPMPLPTLAPLPSPCFDAEHPSHQNCGVTRKNTTSWTECQRLLAGHSLNHPPASFATFQEQLRSFYDGGIKKSEDRYLLIPCDDLPSEAICFEGLDGKLQALLCTSMPQSMRDSLTNSIRAALGRHDILRQRGPQDEPLFEVLHFSWYNRYSTKIYRAILTPVTSIPPYQGGLVFLRPTTSSSLRGQSLSDVLEWVESKIQELVGRDIEIQVECCGSLPLNSRVPLFPFTGLVFNFNVSTKGHRDVRDLGFCIVIPFGDYKGGHFCLKEPGWVFDLRPGDFLLFNSSGITHFNLLYEGICGSIVGHTDKEFLNWLSNFNGWKDNAYLVVRHTAGVGDEEVMDDTGGVILAAQQSMVFHTLSGRVLGDNTGPKRLPLISTKQYAYKMLPRTRRTVILEDEDDVVDQDTPSSPLPAKKQGSKSSTKGKAPGKAVVYHSPSPSVSTTSKSTASKARTSRASSKGSKASGGVSKASMQGKEDGDDITGGEASILANLASLVPGLSDYIHISSNGEKISKAVKAALKKSKTASDVAKHAEVRKRASDMLDKEADAHRNKRQHNDDLPLDQDEEELARMFGGGSVTKTKALGRGDDTDSSEMESSDEKGGNEEDNQAEEEEGDGVEEGQGHELDTIEAPEFIIEELGRVQAKRTREKKATVTLGALPAGPMWDLADLGNKILRTLICSEDPFPFDRKKLTRKALSEAAAASNETRNIWKKLCADMKLSDQKVHVEDYAWKGAATVRGQVKDKAAGNMGAYHIPGGLQGKALKQRIEWLTAEKQFRFAFGDLDIVEQSVNLQKPLGNPALEAVIQSQWFYSSKADGSRYPGCFRNIPHPLWALAMTAIEAALSDWKTGSYIREKFSEELWCKRYKSNLNHVKRLHKKAPGWLENFSRTVYLRICQQGNVSIDEEDEEDAADAGIDFEALEAIAMQVSTNTSEHSGASATTSSATL
ncbi:hypothetical protein OE88DRAFT_1648472 [Heliocybe sulcata]|uniref:DUF6532 domain-containing protein n=1 Tax=Heliocybe sulcata TaxID=5364 RepID=A0A5C3MY92_9AGAM|nr:hypothetical protein OE88DRAFT_1648472 [Heliocybe sulcata]